MSSATASLISRPVANLEDFCAWLKGAEASVRSLPDRNASGNERTNTHNSADLCQVAERLHDLAHEYANLETASLCTLPGTPKHFGKAEILRNLRQVICWTIPVDTDGKAAGWDQEYDPAAGRYVSLRPYLEANPNYIDVKRQGVSPNEAHDLDRIKHYACQHFNHSVFTADTAKRLDDLLRARYKAGTDIFGIPLKEIADILEKECKETVRPAVGGNKQPKRKRGPKAKYDPKQDQRIYDAWKTGQHQDYAALAQAFAMTRRQIQLAMDREKKARSRKKAQEQAPD